MNNAFDNTITYGQSLKGRGKGRGRGRDKNRRGRNSLRDSGGSQQFQWSDKTSNSSNSLKVDHV